MNTRISSLLLILISLALFAGTVYGTFLSLDESEILQALDSFSHDPRDYFLPIGGSAHPYYRPVFGLSLFLDSWMWGTQASGFHLTNILLHVANVLLVYVLALRVTTAPRRELIAFLSAFLFAVHPIHTEAIDWVSGRTDLLATCFALLAFIAYLRFRKDAQWRYLLASAGCYLLGLFSKEVAIAVPLVILAYEFLMPQPGSKAERTKVQFAEAVLYGIATVCYGVLRSQALSRGDTGLAKSIGALDVPWIEQAQSMVNAIGFYIKALTVPFPLNFAVDHIGSLGYLAIGLLSLGVACVALVKRGEASFWMWWILLTLAPSLMIAITGIAWTPVAERYLYLPSVGFSVLTVLLLFAACSRFSQATLPVTAAVLAVCTWFFVGTYLRNAIWQEPILLWEDTVRKSPHFPDARNEYGLALVAEQRYDEAKAQFERAVELGDRQTPLQNLAAIAEHVDRDYQEAERLWSLALEEGASRPRLYTKLAVNHLRRAGSEPEDDSREIMLEAIELYQQAYQHHGNAVALYRIGQIYLRLGDQDKARASFEQAIVKGGPDDFFVAPSKTIVARLASQRG